MQDEPKDPTPPRKPGRKLADVHAAQVDFRVALTPQLRASDKVKLAFSAAINRQEALKQRLNYLRRLVEFGGQLAAQLIRPAEARYIAMLTTEARQMDAWCDSPPHKLTPRRRRRFRELVMDRLARAVHEFGLEELRPLLEKYSPAPSADAQAEAARAASELMSQFLGQSVDPEDLLQGFSPENAEKMQAKYGAAFAEARAQAERPGGRAGLSGSGAGFQRKKTKRELAAEAAQALLDQDLKRIFKNLVMQLHPDREQDETRRREKEELMKVLIRARDENDYSELLRLHVLVNDLAAHPDRAEESPFSASTLKTLTQLLREKSRQLEEDLYELQHEDFLLSRIRLITGVEETDRKQVRTAAERHAVDATRLARDLDTALARYRTDPSDFYHFVDSAPLMDEGPGFLKEFADEFAADDWNFGPAPRRRRR